MIPMWGCLIGLLVWCVTRSEPEIDVALRGIREGRTKCLKRLRSRPLPSRIEQDALLDELASWDALEADWLAVAGTDPM